ncbi:transcription factor DUO1 [Magnolia sinica]|uniref:transcription factor DUO1 n=1 Tax=Magnolia sinica TaxID=86752 RepID=UPI00265B6052|nr:transcription factor DUO1 [Magnolia sinica]
MEGHCRRDEGMAIRKGPWMAEEDEILMDYVKKYGPRDWSSIRSKGLLPRTGKSCRLRWVNKLKPDLKTGCKFSAEEERIVIDLQAQFGNKWARIATYLKGRTDNDVKNFWSTRQKRLARLLQTSPPPRAQKNQGKLPIFHQMAAFEPSRLSSMQFQEEISNIQSGKTSSSMGNSDVIKMVQLPDLVNPNRLNEETDIPSLEYKNSNNKPCPDMTLQFPFTQLPPPALDFPLLAESEDLVTEISDNRFWDMLSGRESCSDTDNGPRFTLGLPFFELDAGHHGTRQEDNIPTTPDSFFDDFPADMFNHLEPLPSPSEW